MKNAIKPSQDDSKEGISEVVKTAEKGISPIKAFWTKFTNDWCFNLSAMLAYNLLLAMFPIIVAIVSILGLFLSGLNPNAENQLIQQIANVFPSSISSQEALKPALNQLAHDSGILGYIAIILAVFGGSRLFISLEACFGIIYHVRQRPIIKQNLMAIGMLLVFVLLVPIMIVAASGPAFVLSILHNTPLAQVPGVNIIFSLGGIIGTLISSWILFQVIYMVVPNQHISFRNAVLGAIIAAVGLSIYLPLFPLYAANFLKGFAGPTGLFVILLVFLYYFALIILIGAEVNAFFAEKIQATPVDLVSMVHIVTSHLPKNQEDKEKQAPPSHKDAPTGDVAEKTGIENAPGNGKHDTAGITTAAAAEPSSAKTTSGQPSTTSPAQSKNKHNKHDKEKEHTTPTSSKTAVVAEAVAGTGLAFLVEWLRLRRKR
ncbi:MAG: YihY/virulence factor BrkB family protein [Chloroflexi bacterium]|nr:MAG: YihY/virulence factor BrkB family protein [Chloroflexota bacterium]